jgi:5'(3')-deoxyribonucleotidase
MSRGTIAIDLDDVLAATNLKVAEIHNELYGSAMTIDDFDYCELSVES